MKHGLFQGSFPPAISMDDCLAIANDLGFDGLEVTLEDPEPLLPEAVNETTQEILAIGQSVGMSEMRVGALHLNRTNAEIDHLAKSAAQTGIRLHSIATMLLFYYPLSSGIPGVRDKGIDIVLKMLEAAAIFEAETILIVPGLVTPQDGYAEVYQRSQVILKELSVEARHKGIKIGIENVWNRFLLSPLEMARYIDEIGSPFIGAYVDVANVLTYGYPEDWLKILGSRVMAVHFKDFRKDIDNILGFTHLLHGDVNWMAVSDALKEINYQGFITVEVPPLKNLPLKGIRDAKSSLDQILANTP